MFVTIYCCGCAVAQLVEIVGLIPEGVIGIFHRHNPSGRTMTLGLTQPLTEMSKKQFRYRPGVAQSVPGS